MNCSNCTVSETNLRANEIGETMCENGHNLCINCYTLSPKRCIQCGGQLIDCNENVLMSKLNANWDIDQICNWMKFNEKHSQYSNDSLDAEVDALADETSMNLLYSRAKSLDKESLDNQHSRNNWNSKWIESRESRTPKINENINFQRQSPTHVENFVQTERKSSIERTDTRQNLLDQMRNEIREKIREELYNSFKNDTRNLIRPEEFMCKIPSKTIGVSTDSKPNLLPEVLSSKRSSQHSVDIKDSNKQTIVDAPKEYLVMNVDTRQPVNPCLVENAKVKKSSSGIDQRFQQVVETVLESESTNQTLTEDKNFLKILQEKFSKIPPNKIEQIISSICNADESKNSNEVCFQYKTENSHTEKSKDFLLISNSSRASYSPPNCQQLSTIPKPQFQLIASHTNSLAQIVDAATLNISRSPVICPISYCQQPHFVSNFTRHIAVDHSQVPLERMFPRQCKNFFLDPKLIHFGSNRCQMLLLVNDKIRNLGHDKFKDFIPVLVMSTKVSSFELCCSKPEFQDCPENHTTGSFLMIWLTGIVAPQEPIFYSLTVWARSGNVPSCHIVHSGQLYSVRNSQNSKTIHESGQMLLLSQNQVDLLTNKGRNMLELQIQIN
ncbi:uncharacterized protein LOC129921487 [Episyrphus balteatus]|uniref:uncharacterized protein LOC129921487 n=1 Tax=Episyrphus balteatus TaxID=286459 RepID=UPI0024851F4C|nr:uncharacterized protein LOC129921487 [Episyrphus balteatus]